MTDHDIFADLPGARDSETRPATVAAKDPSAERTDTAPWPRIGSTFADIYKLYKYIFILLPPAPPFVVLTSTP